jgi:hypothetical protein
MKLFRGQPDHDHWRKPFTVAEKAAAWAGFGLVFLVIGGLHWLAPPVPPFTGKWSWLEGVLYEEFGPPGIPVATLAAGALMFIGGLVTWWEAKHKNAREG